MRSSKHRMLRIKVEDTNMPPGLPPANIGATYHEETHPWNHRKTMAEKHSPDRIRHLAGSRHLDECAALRLGAYRRRRPVCGRSRYRSDRQLGGRPSGMALAADRPVRELAHDVGVLQVPMGDCEVDRDHRHDDLRARVPGAVGSTDRGYFERRRVNGAAKSGLSPGPADVYPLRDHVHYAVGVSVADFDAEAVDEAGYHPDEPGPAQGSCRRGQRGVRQTGGIVGATHGSPLRNDARTG